MESKMNLNWNQILEDAIVGKLIATLVDESFRVEISDQDGGGLFVYAYDGDRRPAKFDHWVRLVPGNGPDVIVDYTTNLEDTLKSVNAFASGFMQ